MYKAIGNTHKIGAVLVDDMPLKADVLNAELARMRESNDDSLTFYSGLLTDRFEFIDPATAIASECISFVSRILPPEYIVQFLSPEWLHRIILHREDSPMISNTTGQIVRTSKHSCW